MKNANNYFGSSNGSENFYHHTVSKILITDGVKELADTCGAYWLVDLIFSHQANKKVRQEPFQVWHLKRIKESEFYVTATDGNDNRIASQEIPFSDFEYDQATLWLVDGCLMLPKEY